jgi:hypothetical protein
VPTAQEWDDEEGNDDGLIDITGRASAQRGIRMRTPVADRPRRA